jgi:hypothetical protein
MTDAHANETEYRERVGVMIGRKTGGTMLTPGLLLKIDGNTAEVLIDNEDGRAEIRRVSKSYAEKPLPQTEAGWAAHYERLESALRNIESLSFFIGQANKEADPDDGNSDNEIEYLRSALSVALTRWPEVGWKD